MLLLCLLSLPVADYLFAHLSAHQAGSVAPLIMMLMALQQIIR